MTDTAETPPTPTNSPSADPTPTGPAPRSGRTRTRNKTTNKSASGTDSTPKPGRPTAKTNRARRVQALYETIGAGLMFASIAGAPRAAHVGHVMQDNASALGEAWAQWAETSPRIAKLIDNLSAGGAGIAVLIAHIPLIQALVSDPAETPGLSDAFGPMAAMFAQMAGADATPTD